MGAEILDAALEYALMGWPVLPVRGKTHAMPRGVYDATTDLDTVRGWLAGDEDGFGVGIACGGDRELVVLNIDPARGGRETIEQIQGEHGKLPAGPVVETGGGGWHLYLRGPGGWSPSLGAGVTLMHSGTYVVAPPSQHESGSGYKWLRPLVRSVPDAPKWLGRLAAARRERLTKLAEHARVLLGRGVDLRVAVELLGGWAGSAKPALSASEVVATVKAVAAERLVRMDEQLDHFLGASPVSAKGGAT